MDNLQPGTAPKVTPADIEAEIASEHYFRASDGVIGMAMLLSGRAPAGHDALATVPQSLSLLTFCVLVLRNGFTVTGESACASPENFDAGIGRKVARAAAISKCYALLGFRLRDRLATAAPTVDADKLAQMGVTIHYPHDTSDLKAPAGMEIVETEVINNPNDFGYLLCVTASVGGKNKTEARGFMTGHTPSATEKNKQAAHAQCIALLQLAFGIKR